MSLESVIIIQCEHLVTALVMVACPITILGEFVSIRYTAKTQYRKFETNIPRQGIAGPESQCPHSCVCERFIYYHDLSACSAAEKYLDRSWK
jgi:hypothetical protein